MPRKVSWKARIGKILEDLQSAPEQLDRVALARILGIGRSQSFEVLRELGANADGIFPRETLVSYVEEHRPAPLVATDRVDQLDESEVERLRRVRISVQMADVFRGFDDLPNVSLEPGRLVIVFDSPQDLLRQLFQLARAVKNDEDGFNALTSKGIPHDDRTNAPE